MRIRLVGTMKNCRPTRRQKEWRSTYMWRRRIQLCAHLLRVDRRMLTRRIFDLFILLKTESKSFDLIQSRIDP